MTGRGWTLVVLMVVVVLTIVVVVLVEVVVLAAVVALVGVFLAAVVLVDVAALRTKTASLRPTPEQPVSRGASNIRWSRRPAI